MFNPYIPKITTDGTKNPCTRECKERTATCRPTCEKYMAYREKLNADNKARSIERDANYVALAGKMKNKDMRAKANKKGIHGYGY